MTWQDIMLGVIVFGFDVSLIPTVISRREKPPVATSSTNAMLMFLMLVPQISLGLWIYATATVICACEWLTIAVQTQRKARNEAV